MVDRSQARLPHGGTVTSLTSSVGAERASQSSRAEAGTETEATT